MELAGLVPALSSKQGCPRRYQTEISACGMASRIARWYSPLVSVETARIGARRSPSSAKERCRVALLRLGAHHTIAPLAWSANRRQVALAAAVGDVVDADSAQALQAPLVEVVGHHTLDDRPTESQPMRSNPAIGVLTICWASQATTSSKSRVYDEPGRAHGTGSSRTTRRSRTAQPAQLALDHAPAGTDVEVAPALDAAVMNLQLCAGMAAARADSPSAAQADGHHDPSAPIATSTTDAPDRRSSRLSTEVTRTSSSFASR